MMRSGGMTHEQFVDALKRNDMTLDKMHCATDESCGYYGWTGIGAYEARLANTVRARDEWKRLMVAHP